MHFLEQIQKSLELSIFHLSSVLKDKVFEVHIPKFVVALASCPFHFPSSFTFSSTRHSSTTEFFSIDRLFSALISTSLPFLKVISFSCSLGLASGGYLDVSLKFLLHVVPFDFQDYKWILGHVKLVINGHHESCRTSLMVYFSLMEVVSIENLGVIRPLLSLLDVLTSHGGLVRK